MFDVGNNPEVESSIDGPEVEADGVETTELNSTEHNAEQLKRVEESLQLLVPVMETFKDASKDVLEENFVVQVTAIEQQLGEVLSAESRQMIHERLVGEVLAQKNTVVTMTENLTAEREKLSETAERKFSYILLRWQQIDRTPELIQAFQEFGRSKPTDEQYDAVARQLNELYKEYMKDPRVPSDKIPEFAARVKEVAAELKGQSVSVSEGNPGAVAVDQAPSSEAFVQAREADVLERATDIVPTEESNEEMVAQFADGTLPPDKASFVAKAIELDDDDDEQGGEASAAPAGMQGGTDTEFGGAVPGHETEADGKAVVVETITNLVKSPESVLGNPTAEEEKNSRERAVAVLLDAMRKRYPNEDELIKRLTEVFQGYKLAWALDRKSRPGLDEAAHKKAAMEEVTRDLPEKDGVVIDQSINQTPGLTREKVMSQFFELIEAESNLVSPDTSSLEPTPAE